MGRIILKAAKDVDLYCEWSTIVDHPVYIGTRAEIAAELLRQYHPASEVEVRLARVDERGTSAMDGGPLWGDYSWFGAWDYDSFTVQQRGGLPRTRLAEFLRLLCEDNETAAYALLDPFDATITLAEVLIEVKKP